MIRKITADFSRVWQLDLTSGLPCYQRKSKFELTAPASDPALHAGGVEEWLRLSLGLIAP
ncbi:uncharacterized protein N7529_000054 [Penicillium soppii]|jgi:hypothetical protein|uniref:uncharacterized protein n=1 Tax=Penicillium soppii TaxID=69789 RepID=UPI0025489A66|nr:uncharacterized protein N7529_000054 [Penicillium soppii]KAJ5881382.1 hypothetical protein N7529_000054 [Penicillium soppii]